MLDDRNVNDQGIDASGATISSADYILSFSKLVHSFVVEADATAAAAAVNAIEAGVAVKTGAATPWTVTMSKGTLVAGTLVEVTAVQAKIATVTIARNSGNLYGSSKDIGKIGSRIPTLTEVGGRVNRVGFTRLERTGTITKFGFFTEFTQESLDFDSDSELYGHMSRELVTGATQLTEAVLQKDLLLAAGTILYAGAATTPATVTGEGTISVVDYDDFTRLATILNDNRTPTQTKVITGSRMVDTKTINRGRVMFIGSELESVVKNLADSFGDRAFVPVHQYADAGTILTGEIGTIDQFRIVVVPEMLHWAGTGANVVTNPGYPGGQGGAQASRRQGLTSQP